MRLDPIAWLARLEGLEPPTIGLEVRCSIHLSYRRISEAKRACPRDIRPRARPS